MAKRCTFRGSRKCPALRGFVAGRWALATTSLYPSTKIERPQRARNGASWRRSFSALDTTLRGAGSPRFPLPSAAAPYTVQRRRNTINRCMGPTPTRKPAHRTDTTATGAPSGSTVPRLSTPEGSWAKVGAGHARKRRLAAARGKPNALLAPPKGGSLSLILAEAAPGLSAL